MNVAKKKKDKIYLKENLIVEIEGSCYARLDSYVRDVMYIKYMKVKLERISFFTFSTPFFFVALNCVYWRKNMCERCLNAPSALIFKNNL